MDRGELAHDEDNEGTIRSAVRASRENYQNIVRARYSLPRIIGDASPRGIFQLDASYTYILSYTEPRSAGTCRYRTCVCIYTYIHIHVYPEEIKVRHRIFPLFYDSYSARTSAISLLSFSFFFVLRMNLLIRGR